MCAWLIDIYNNFKGDKRGVVAVEFGLLLPLLFVILVGLFEFGRFLNHYAILQQSVRMAVEYTARYNDADEVGTTSMANASTEIQNLVKTGQPTGGTNLLEGWGNTSDTPTIQISITTRDDLSYTGSDPYSSGNNFTGTVDALVIRIEAQVIYEPFVSGFLSNFGKMWMSAAHEQIWIGMGTGLSSGAGT